MRTFPSDLTVQAGVINALEALTDAVEQRLQMAEARIAARRARLTERMRTRRAQLAKDSAPGEHISPAYLSRCIGEAVGEDAIIFNEYPLRPTIARARSRARCSRSARPAASAGASAPRSAPSSRHRTSSSSRRSATAPTCSPIRWSDIGSPANTICRSSPSCSTTAATAPCATRRCRCSRTASPAKTTAATLADLDPAPPFDEWRARKARYAERVEKPADLPDALVARPRRRRQRTPPSAAQRHHALLNAQTGVRETANHGE